MVSQSSGSPSFTSASPSLNQRPRQPPDFTSSNRVHTSGPNPAGGPLYSQVGAGNSSAELLPPNRPFGGGNGGGGGSQRSSLMSASSSSLRGGDSSSRDAGNGQGASTSLSVNFLPSKFSRPHSPGIHARRVASNPKLRQSAYIRGGGNAAFKSGEARIAGANDEDYDGVNPGGKWGVGRSARLRWTRFKWILFVMNSLLTIYSMVALIFCLLTWLNVWNHAEIIIVANKTELILSTVAASMGTLTSLIGWAGILLNNRAFLAVYTLFLWICFGLLVAPGYVTYKTRTFNLELKLNALWSRVLGQQGRLQIQNKLECCGYFSPFIEATASQTCYARAQLPGCKGEFLKFQKLVLSRWYTVAFSLVPLQIAAILSGLLCSNHVTYRFGKGMMPKAYRLNMETMGVIMDNYAQQLAEQYGEDVAQEVLAKSRARMGGLSVPQSPGGGAGVGSPSPLTQSFSSTTGMLGSAASPAGTSSLGHSSTGGAGRRTSSYATYGGGSDYPMNSMNSNPGGGAGGGARI